MPPISLRSLALEWSLDPGAALLVLVAGSLYAAGVRRLAQRGRRWPVARTAAFAGGLALVVMATQSGLAGYDTVLFSAHVVQHVLLAMAAPVLLALGAPVTLALQASSRPMQTALLRIVHGGPVAALTHPLVAWLVFGGSLFALYLTPLFAASLRNDLVHAAVHVHFLVAGCLFFWPLVGLDPVRWRLPHGARALLVFLTVPFHAVAGLTILTMGDLLAGGFYAEAPPAWAASALTDQRTGAGILWAVGDLLGLVVVGIVLAQWWSHEERVAARADRALA